MRSSTTRGDGPPRIPLRGSDSKGDIGKLPFTLTWPFLTGLALYIIGFLVALELSRQAFQNVENRDIRYNATAAGVPYVSARGLGRRKTAAADAYRGWQTPSPMPAAPGTSIHRPWRRANATESNGTTAGYVSAQGPSDSPATVGSVQLTAATSSQGESIPSIKPTVAITSPETPNLQPLVVGYRTIYPASNLDDPQTTLGLLPRRPETGRYGTFGQPQRIVWALSLPKAFERNDVPNQMPAPEVEVVGKFVGYFAYVNDSTQYRDLQAILNPDGTQDLDVYSPGESDDLCRMRCNGPFIIVSGEPCLRLWDVAFVMDFLNALFDLALGVTMTFTEKEFLGGTRCPMPTQVGEGKVAYETDITVVETRNGVATTTTRHTRLTTDPPPFETAAAAAGAGASLVPMTLTVNGADGTPSTTITTAMPVRPTVLTQLDAEGRPTGTVTTAVLPVPTHYSLSNPPGGPSYWHELTPAEYLLGTFGPVLLAVPLSFATQALGAQVRAQLPFLALSAAGGAPAGTSLFLRTRGPGGPAAGWRVLRQGGGPLGVLADALVATAAAVVALSGEAVGVLAYGACTRTDSRGCRRDIAVYGWVSRVVEAALAVMLVVVALVAVFSRRMRVRVREAPLGITALAGLMSDEETKRVLGAVFDVGGDRVREKEIVAALEGRVFSLRVQKGDSGRFAINNAEGTEEHPLSASRSGTRSESILSKLGLSTHMSEARQRYLDLQKDTESVETGSRSAFTTSIVQIPHRIRPRPVAKAVFLAIICGFLILIVYYESTQLKTPFEHFMNNQGFGVRLLFNSIGVLIPFFWESHFAYISLLEPYRRLALRSQAAERSVLISPTAIPLVGLIRSTAQRDFVVAPAALMAVLATMTPILLSNIPFNPIQTWSTHQTCTWMAVGILALMILVLLLDWIFVKYPRLPVHPGTLGGGLYYTCNSQMTEVGISPELQGSRKYRLRPVMGASGHKRIGVDFAEDDPT